MSGDGPGENLEVALGAAIQEVLPGVGLLALVGLYALAVGVALIVLALGVRGLRRHGGREVA